MTTTNPIRMHTVSEHLIIGEPPIRADSELANYVVLFNCDTILDFSFGVSEVSPREAKRRVESFEPVTRFVKLLLTESSALRPPYKGETRLVVAIRRLPHSFEFCFKNGNSESGIYTLKSPLETNYLAIRCHNSTMLGSDLIKVLSPAEYQMMSTEERDGRCVHCYKKAASVTIGRCGHVVYCSNCNPRAVECTICYAHYLRSQPRFLES